MAAEDLSLRWIETEADARRAAEAMAAIIAADPGYICFDEYIDAESPDGALWAPDAAASVADGLVRGALSGDYPIAIVEDGAGRLLAGAAVSFGSNGVEAFVKIEDFVVAPEARGQGLARRLLDALLNEARSRGAARAFLETSARNAAARRLFESAGFAPVSTLYSRPLKPA